MRHGFTPEIDTREIADTELDAIAGGNAAAAGADVAGHGAAVSIGNGLEARRVPRGEHALGQIGGIATVGITPSL